MHFQVKNRYFDLSKSFRQYLVLLCGFLLTVIAFFVYRHLVIIFSTFVSSLVLFFLIRKKPATINLEIDQTGFKIEREKVLWQDCLAWSILDLGDAHEFVIHTDYFSQNFYYFYLNKNDIANGNLMMLLSQNIPYNPEVTYQNQSHNLLRKLKLI